MATDTADESRPSTDSKRGMMMQVLTAVALSMMGINIGASVSFSGVFAEQMTSEQADLELSGAQISWVASTYAIGNMLGFILSSYANPRLGAIRVVQLCSPVVAGGWLLLTFGHSFGVILAGRALIGIGVATAFGPIITHIGDITSVHVRGPLSVLMNVMLSAGILSICLFGWLLGWRRACLVIGTGSVLFMFFVTIMLPPSARWLIAKGHPVQQAQQSLRFYHGQSYDVDKEIRSITESLGDGHKCDASLLEVLKLLKYGRIWKPFCIVLATWILFICSGGFVTAAYAPVVFKQVGQLSNPYIGSVLVGVLRVVSSILSSVIISRCERKTMLMWNGAVGGLACLVSGCLLYYGAELADHGWASLVAILVIVGAMSLGVAILTTVLQAELLPNAVRAELGGVLLLLSAVLTFTTLYAFPLVISLVGMSGVYWFFAAMHAAMFVFAKLCVPETRGKSIEEIQKIFEQNNDAIKISQHRTTCES